MKKTTRILVVEDEPDFQRLLTQRFRKEISNGKYHFVFSGNGVEALAILQADPDFEIVLSDIRMPRMDGLTLLASLRESHSDLVPIIISAYGDMPNIRAAMNLGAFDFVTKPINFSDLEITLQKTLKEVETIRQAAKARELELMNDQLHKLDQMKSQIFTNISHEFRTPLTIISGMADQIEIKPDKWLSRGVKMIKRNSSHLLYLVDQIMDLAKLEAGDLRLNPVRGNIVDHLTQVIEPCFELAERNNIQLDIVDHVHELWMAYDPDKIRKILFNLLSNAIKFNTPGGKVQFILEQSPRPPESGTMFLIITIKDTGIGIPEDHLPFIFNRFYQVDGSSTRAGEGTGIGLALVKEMLELMDGIVTVSSKVEQGSVFQIAIPTHPVNGLTHPSGIAPD